MVPLTNEALEDAIATLATQQDMVEHRLLTLIRDLDHRQRCRAHGLATTAAWLGWRIGLGVVAAREKVRVANALGQLPNIDAAFAKGEVSYSKVRAMTRIATPENEARLLYLATQGTAAQLEVICRGVARMQPSSAPEAGARWLRVHADTDGMVRIELRLHADEAKLLLNAVDLARDDSAEAPLDRVDGLLRVADGFLASPDHGRTGGDRTQLIVTVGPNALGDTSARIEDAPLSAATLARVACDASLTVVTVDADGDPLDVGRKTRIIPSAIRRALLFRDGGCRFPGCTHRRALDAHHIEHWGAGGATAKDNLVLLCAAHHRAVHEGGFQVSRADGRIHFARPDGTIIPASPVPRSLPLALPATRSRREIYSPRPEYGWAIGVVAPLARSA